jgi:hypothetical protein
MYQPMNMSTDEQGSAPPEARAEATFPLGIDHIVEPF